MSAKNLNGLASQELVDLFTKLALAKGKAVMGDETANVARLYRQIEAVQNELKLRAGDERRLLASLFNHLDTSVRLETATVTLAVFPKQARQTLQNIYDWKEYPFTLDTGSLLLGLESGAYEPT